MNSAPLKAKFCKRENWFFKQILYLKFASKKKKINLLVTTLFVCLKIFITFSKMYAVKICTCLPAFLLYFPKKKNFRSPYQKKVLYSLKTEILPHSTKKYLYLQTYLHLWFYLPVVGNGPACPTQEKMVTQKTEIFKIFLYYYHEIKISKIFPVKIEISK